MNLIKTSLWSAIYTTVRILAGLITTKIMAVYVGPTGLALLGNFNNITTILTTFSSGAINTGITKYISEFEAEEEKRNVVSHAIKISLICSFIIGLIVLMLNGPLAIWSFGDLKYRFAFIIFGLTIAFFGLNTTISSVLNGYRQIKYMIITGMIGSVISVFLALIITMKFGIMGALVNTAIGQICIFLINVQFIKHLKLFGFKMLRESFNKVLSWKLFKYAAMSLVSVLVVPTSTLIIRMYVFNNFSTNEAGFIQAVWGISSIYLMIITTALSVYYLPTLSGIKHDADLKKEIFNGYKLLLPLAILGGVAIYQCRDLIIFILYTPEFSPMKEYFLFQIIGDSFKIASWILGYLMVAKAMTSWFIATEIIFSGTYLVFSFAFMKYYGSVGVTYGYALNYLLYLTFMVFLFRKILFSHKSSKLND